ncbi:uncharacterized protein [Branchiostoma lanceolatum]|uniref:uncharacterized protein n=1 Tax=Branchiostoma lanceolatum TaxID=7740 RepID=UPI003451B6B5
MRTQSSEKAGSSSQQAGPSSQQAGPSSQQAGPSSQQAGPSSQQPESGGSSENTRESSQHDAIKKPAKAEPEITCEGWHLCWESQPGGFPEADLDWLQNDVNRGLFQPVKTYKPRGKKATKKRKLLKDDRMWFYPPEPPGVVQGNPPSADAFFRSRVFFWRPMGVWKYTLRCPSKDCKGAILNRSGYSSTVRQICDVSGWYSMVTEVLACNECKKSADRQMKKYNAWDDSIISQLSPAHQAVFPAVLTLKRGVDKNVVRLLRDRTGGNTMAKARRQLREAHCEDYLYRKDLYMTLLESIDKPGSVVGALGHQFPRPPPRRELPCPNVLRKAYLMSEAANIEDYRTQIMSVFGKVLKLDSTKKICKKLSGEGKGTAEWCTNVGNERGQILTSVLTCEESVEKLGPMSAGLMSRYRKAGEATPQVMYVDRGCCAAYGVSSVEQLFGEWVADGMLTRLDAFHWMHRFDAAVRTDHHPKYALFKSALSAAVFAYNKEDVGRLVAAIRAGDPTRFNGLTDEDLMASHVTKEQLKHYVRRVTVGAQETFARVEFTIETLKGTAGLDDNQIHLFKDVDAIDKVWGAQQKHIECIQDPPDMPMYTITKYATKNGHRLPYYTTVRGSNSLEGFHKFLPDMIPGPHCAAIPFQVYLLSGIARWNANREAGSVLGLKGRRNTVYTNPLIHRLNERGKRFFGEEEEVNFRPPVPVGEEKIGLEYLFAQSSEDFSTVEHYAETRHVLQTAEEGDGGKEEDIPEEEDNDDDVDDGYRSEGDADVPDLAALRGAVRINLTDNSMAAELDPVMEDVCGSNHVDGFSSVENLAKVLVAIASEGGNLSLSEEDRSKVVEAWNKLELHDRNVHQFHSMYRARWGNPLFGRTKGHPVQAALVQRLKLGKKSAPAHLIDYKNSRLMYCVVKQLWLSPPPYGTSTGTPQKNQIVQLYTRLQHRVVVDDPVLSKLGIPLLKINIKSVREFIKRQEALARHNVTNQGLAMMRRQQSVSTQEAPPAPELPTVLPLTDRPQTEYKLIPSLAGTRVLKSRIEHFVPQASTSSSSTTVHPPSVPHHPPPWPVPPQPPLVQHHPPPPVQNNPPPLYVGTPVQFPSTNTMSRATYYKRKKAPESMIPNKTKVQKNNCSLCKESTQGHRKYKLKNFCEKTKRSTSKGLANIDFKDFEHFKAEVDKLYK